ncbi:MAG: hypothetical protein JNK37_03305 [Verrucomicrobiales bacterium]|nr:hypothetical protein [Verrucomicrobiales bacterium]
MKSISFTLSLGLAAALMLAGLVSTLAAPPANDNFANATPITGLSGSTTGSNLEATLEVDEPEPSFPSNTGTSVWWAWTAPQSGVFVFDTLGSGPDKNAEDFDHVLTIYTGTTLTDLEEIGSEEVSIPVVAVAGQTYFLSVRGQDLGSGPDEGDIMINWAPLPPGEISVFKETYTSVDYSHGVDEDSPQVPTTSTSVTPSISFVVYDSTNGRVGWINTWTEKVGRRTQGYFTHWGVNNVFSFDVVPGRVAGTQHWLSSFVSSRANQTPAAGVFLGEGELQGDAYHLAGLATPLVLGRAPNTVTITVPRLLSGRSLWSTHTLLEEGIFDEDTQNFTPNGFLTRKFYRSNGSILQQLDLATTAAAMLSDFTTDGITYPKATVENGVARMISLLKRVGYQEVN